ncbi:hypothetical protein KAR91_55770 [Candidatus Pacearchaeota archaeon]|nr:hypothetical protein [Candidatus Pacearchaeota archaeon]
MSQLTQPQIKRILYKRLYHKAVEMDEISVVWDELECDCPFTKQDRERIKLAYDKFLDEVDKKSKIKE